MTAHDVGARRLAAVLRLSNRMLEAARAGTWQEVSRLQGERDLAMGALFADPRRVPADADRILATVLELNHEIAARARSERDRCGGDLRRSRRHRRAESAYGGTAPRAPTPLALDPAR